MVRITHPPGGRQQPAADDAAPKAVRVLKPPGGGSSISFGGYDEEVPKSRAKAVAAAAAAAPEVTPAPCDAAPSEGESSTPSEAPSSPSKDPAASSPSQEMTDEPAAPTNGSSSGVTYGTASNGVQHSNGADCAGDSVANVAVSEPQGIGCSASDDVGSGSCVADTVPLDVVQDACHSDAAAAVETPSHVAETSNGNCSEVAEVTEKMSEVAVHRQTSENSSACEVTKGSSDVSESNHSNTNGSANEFVESNASNSSAAEVDVKVGSDSPVSNGSRSPVATNGHATEAPVFNNESNDHFEAATPRASGASPPKVCIATANASAAPGPRSSEPRSPRSPTSDARGPKSPSPDTKDRFYGAKGSKSDAAPSKPYLGRPTPSNHHMRSSIFTGHDEEPSYPVPSKAPVRSDKARSPPQQQQAPVRVRQPPGGFSTALW